MSAKPRIEYIDNLRIYLTIIVILHHLMITYGAPGGWYYREFEYSQLDIFSLTSLVLITAANQAYFMGFFFFISGYFSSKSLTSKTPSRFFWGRIFRLGLPILLFVYLVSPLLRVIFKRIIFDHPVNLSSFIMIYQQLEFGYELGPMWFILLLLILSILFLPWSMNPKYISLFQEIPSPLKILLFALFTGIFTFLIRIYFPVGYVFQPLNLQTPHVLQYIFLFFMGIVAFHGKWFDQLELIFSRSWLYLILGLLLSMPIIFILSGGLEEDLGPALGSFHWQSFAYSLWEQLFCVSIIITGLFYFHKYVNSSSRLSREIADSSYAAFIIHPLVLVTYSALIHQFSLHPLLKISLSILPVLFMVFLTAAILRRFPGLKYIL